MTKRKEAHELKNAKKTTGGKTATSATVAPAAAEEKVKPQAKKPQPKKPRPEVTVTPSACPNCGSTERTGYAGTKARKLSGQLPDGRRYQTVVWKPTKCRGCNQNRVDVYHLDRPYKKSDGDLIDD
jgi:hypothetical protein